MQDQKKSSTMAIGFIVTGVGLPLLGVLAFGFSGKSDLHTLASRVHPVFGAVFTTVLYLAIGPLFAIPRTGSVSYEVGVKPLLGESDSAIALLLFTIIFFAVTCFFSLNSTKIVYIVSITFTFIVSLFDGLKAAGIQFEIVNTIFSVLPLYSVGIGWLVPAITGAFLGYAFSLIVKGQASVIAD